MMGVSPPYFSSSFIDQSNDTATRTTPVSVCRSFLMAGHCNWTWSLVEGTRGPWMLLLLLMLLMLFLLVDLPLPLPLLIDGLKSKAVSTVNSPLSMDEEGESNTCREN